MMICKVKNHETIGMSMHHLLSHRHTKHNHDCVDIAMQLNTTNNPASSFN